MRHELLLADESQKEAVGQLRMSEYAKASGFELDLATLKWQQADNESFILVAIDGDVMVSTMRGEVIHSQELLEKKLECPWSFPLELQHPVLLLSRAATHFSMRNEGLNMILRHWFLQFAKEHELPFVIGTFVSKSPRENSLREMGYDFFENSLGWQQSTYKSLRPVQVVALNMKVNGLKAIDYCQSKMSQGIQKYPFLSAIPELKFTGSL
jgi:hypothetical protein